MEFSLEWLNLEVCEVLKDHGAHPDLDARASCSAEPVAVRAEAESIDGISSIQSVQVLPFVQIPQHGLAILFNQTTDKHKHSWATNHRLTNTPHEKPDACSETASLSSHWHRRHWCFITTLDWITVRVRAVMNYQAGQKAVDYNILQEYIIAHNVWNKV